MTPTSRRFAKAFVGRFPRFAERIVVLPGGDFDAVLLAPRNSKARVLVCQCRSDDVWIRLGLPHSFYSVDSTRELVGIVGGLLKDEVQFVLLSNARK